MAWIAQNGRYMSGPDLAIALTSRDFAVLDASSESLLPVREKNHDRLALFVLDLDSYSVRIGETDI
ncbi:MAG TPA: hypothetical protein VMS99_06525 [Acidimicrobiia bacterium]|nr:hypothetical protein [Acidimicrobiia bacterium]